MRVNVPANITHFYQALDVTVNGFYKKFLTKKFTNWYAPQLYEQLEKGIKLGGANVKLLMSTLMPLHAGWIVDFCNEITTPNGMEIIESGWITSGVQNAIKLGSKGLPPIDTFENVGPLINENEASNEANQVQAICALTAEERGSFEDFLNE